MMASELIKVLEDVISKYDEDVEVGIYVDDEVVYVGDEGYAIADIEGIEENREKFNGITQQVLILVPEAL